MCVVFYLTTSDHIPMEMQSYEEGHYYPRTHYPFLVHCDSGVTNSSYITPELGAPVCWRPIVGFGHPCGFHSREHNASILVSSHLRRP